MIVPQLNQPGVSTQPLATLPGPREAGSTPASTPAPRPSPQQLQQAVEQIQHVVSFVAQNLQFEVDQGTGKTVIRVVDSSTKEVIRQIPTEEAMAISRALDRMQGLLLNGKA